MPFEPRRGPQARLLLAVAGAHLMLLLLLQTARVWRDRSPATTAREPLVVRLLTPSRPAPPAAAPPAPTSPGRPSLRLPPPTRAADAVEVPAAAALPVAPLVAAEPAAPASAPVRPLLLDLPRRASGPLANRNPALDDPRVVSPKATLESRIAGAVGSADWVEEKLGDGRVRFRKGSLCVEVRPNSAAQLFPFNESVRPSNRLATNC